MLARRLARLCAMVLKLVDSELASCFLLLRGFSPLSETEIMLISLRSESIESVSAENWIGDSRFNRAQGWSEGDLPTPRRI